MRSLPIALLAFALSSCGSGTANWEELFGKCASPRSGTDPATGRPYPDQKGTATDEKMFLRAWTDDLYLWYNEVPNVDPSKLSVIDYFNELRTPAKTPSGNDKDRFHFSIPTAEWEALSQSGVEVGYGITWVVVKGPRAPRQYVAGFVEPGSPAEGKISRGQQIISIDGADFVNGTDQGTVDKLNAGLFPAAASESHVFVVEDMTSKTQTTVTVTSAAVTSNPVPDVRAIDTTTGRVGYMLFNDHIATAEKALIDAVNKLKTPPLGPIDDLIIDIRYNGGGFLAIASQLAYMIAGPAATSGKVFEVLSFNNKHPNVDPVTGRAIQPTPFYNQTIGFNDLAPGTALPTLNLKKLFVLTGRGTCSASESILNGLAGVNVPVIQIGSTTCGKPYGFYPQDNCGTTYFSIQFKGVNAKGFGDYADGFVPGILDGAFAGCSVADDFGHPLGDINEGRLAAALDYRMSKICPFPTIVPALVFGGGFSGDGPVLKSPWRQNRILLRR